jgi:hypothetical protein
VKTTLALLLLATTLLGLTSRAHAQSAGELATDCAPYRHGLILDAKPGGRSLVEAPGANNNSAFCWGAFAALQDFADLQRVGALQLSTKPTGRVCIPLGTERLQLVKAFLRYVDANAQVRPLAFGVALLAAMQQAYPCSGGASG